MNSLPRQKLCELIAKHGESLCDEPLKCEGLLRDLCPQYRLEVNVLIDAIKEHITADLRNSSDSLPLEVTLARLTKRFQDHRGATPETARWAVESWALALGKISEHDLSKHPTSSAPSLKTGAPISRPQASALLKEPSASEKRSDSCQPQRAVMELSSETASDRRLRKLTWALVLSVAVLVGGIAALWYFAIFLPQQRSQRTTAQSVTPEPAVQPTAAPTGSPTAHVVARGETLTSMAKFYGLSCDELQKYNHIEDPTKLQVGQIIFIPPTAGAEEARIAEEKRQHQLAEEKVTTRQPPSGKELLALSGDSHFVNSVAFSPDGRRIVTGGPFKTAKVWDAQSGKELLTLKGHSNSVKSVVFSPDGSRIVTGSNDNTAKVWDAQSGKKLLTFGERSGNVNSVAFSPDGLRVVTGSNDKTAKVWDAQSGKELLALSGHLNTVNAVTFSPDGKRIVTGSQDKTAKVWDAQSGKELLTLSGDLNNVYADVRSVAFSPDGKRIVTGNNDKTAKVWDAQSGKELLMFSVGEYVHSVAFSPDGGRIVTGGDYKTAKIWELTIEE